MIWLLENTYPLLHGIALALSWGVLGWLIISHLVNPRRKRTKFRSMKSSSAPTNDAAQP